MPYDEEEARRYGKYARHLFELQREQGPEGVVLFLEYMEADELRSLLGHLVEAGAILTNDARDHGRSSDHTA